MSDFLKLQTTRRSIYALGKNVPFSTSALSELIEKAITQTPSAFNSQTSRAVLLFGQESEYFWRHLTASALEKIMPADAFEQTKEKLDGFAAGIGTILFFEDQDVITTLEEKYPRYAENFKLWSEQSHGIALYAAWLALAERGIGMSVQHYNPLVDVQVAEKYALPQSWRLRAQAPFGSIEAPAGEKEFMDRGERFKVFGD